MSRGWMDSDMLAPEPLCHRAAWAWLIENAAFAPRTVQIGGQTVDLDRGQLVASIRYLAGQWRWDKSRVHRFLTKLKGCNAIETATATANETGHTLISVCNYEKYQSDDEPSETAIETPLESRSRHERKKENTNLSSLCFLLLLSSGSIGQAIAMFFFILSSPAVLLPFSSRS